LNSAKNSDVPIKYREMFIRARYAAHTPQPDTHAVTILR